MPSLEEVTSIIRNIKSRKAVREIDVDTKFAQYSNMIISPIICDLFNSCIEQGFFPDALKVTEVVPVFKKGNSIQATNYRPIFRLSQFSKILEKLVFTRLYSYLEKLDLLSRCQYGFRKNSSTFHTICSIYEKLLKNVDAGLYTSSIFLDLAKAFDTVDQARREGGQKGSLSGGLGIQEGLEFRIVRFRMQNSSAQTTACGRDDAFFFRAEMRTYADAVTLFCSSLDVEPKFQHLRRL